MLCAVAAIAAGAVGFGIAAPPATIFDTQAVDPSVKPGDDFYRYANNAWLKAATLPEGAAKYDTSSALRKLNAERVRDLVQMAAAAPGSNAIAKKIGDYYASMMDEAGIEAKGLTPLSDELAAIAAITDRQSVSRYLGRTLHLDDGTNTQTDGLFGVWIHQGFDQADHNVPHVLQGGLGLADGDAYLDSKPESVEHRNAYKAHIAAVFKLAGMAQADARADRILALETAIARTHASRADTDDVFKANNKWNRDDFDRKAPGLDWATYFKEAELDGQADFVVWQPSAVIGSAALVAAQPIDTWKDYLTFHLIEHYAGVLPKSFASAPPPQDRAPLAIAATNAALGEDVGKLYIERFFPPQAKAAANAMAENIRTAFRARIANLTWMSPATREAALAKLAAVKIGLGYPDTWIDYSQLVVVRGDAFGNRRRAEAFAYKRELAKLRQPVDPGEWYPAQLLPQNVGALINFFPNSLQFTAGLLQPPYFDPAGDAASNYGSAGAGMAHEVSHSFDELGNIYDAQGRVVKWWAADDAARYQAAAAPLAAQFGAYCPKPNLCVNGKQVLGENIADIAGLLTAHDAYLLSLHGKPDVVKNGLTGEQRFFLAFARRWRNLHTDAALSAQIAADTHAPGEYRSDTVRNVEAWARAFDVKPGDKLYLKPEDRVRIW
jgi:predicted metalloendopeptidase